jgi:hypothetical protein
MMKSSMNQIEHDEAAAGFAVARAGAERPRYPQVRSPRRGRAHRGQARSFSASVRASGASGGSCCGGCAPGSSTPALCAAGGRGDGRSDLAAAGRRYGLALFCRVWEAARSSPYAALRGQWPTAPPPRPEPRPVGRGAAGAHARRPRAFTLDRLDRRGAPPQVWTRLRAIDSLRVSRKRVLRPMREHALLSRHRARRWTDTATHERCIGTAAPVAMWATVASQTAMVADGKVWLFGVAEHRTPNYPAGTWPSAAPATRPSRRSA